MGPDSAEQVLPLSAAAAIAYEAVSHARPRPPSVEELDLIAFVLSSQLPIYGVRAAGQEASRISDQELMQGVFWGGATCFELGDNIGAFTQLTVRKADFERVLDELKRNPFKL